MNKNWITSPRILHLFPFWTQRESESLIQTTTFSPQALSLFFLFFFFCCIVIYPFNKCKHYKLLASFTCSLSIEAATHSQWAHNAPGDGMRAVPLVLLRLPPWVSYVQQHHLWSRSVWRSFSPRQQTHASTPAVGPETEGETHGTGANRFRCYAQWRFSFFPLTRSKKALIRRIVWKLQSQTLQ